MTRSTCTEATANLQQNTNVHFTDHQTVTLTAVEVFNVMCYINLRFTYLRSLS